MSSQKMLKAFIRDLMMNIQFVADPGSQPEVNPVFGRDDIKPKRIVLLPTLGQFLIHFIRRFRLGAAIAGDAIRNKRI